MTYTHLIAPFVPASDGLQIRETHGGDITAIQKIYAHHVLKGRASFEEVPPDAAELSSRRAAILKEGLPYLVAEMDGQILGYSYATRYRPRSAYRYTLEDSVYVAEGFAGRGIGKALLIALLARCEAGPWRQMLATIGDSENAGSIGLHASLGFRLIGTLQAVGFKHGRWLNTVLMQRELGSGNNSLPDARNPEASHLGPHSA